MIMSIIIRLLAIIAALWACLGNASMATRVYTPATHRVETPATTRVQTPASTRVQTPATTDRALTSTNAETGTTRTKTTSRTRQLVRTTVLFPPIQSQYRLGDITADLINQKGGTSTFVATACTSTTISNNGTCVSMIPVTYSLAKSTLLYSEAGVGSVNCKINVKSAKPTQTCTITKPVYAPDVITTGTVRPTATPLRSETSSTFWIGTATGYVYADIWGNDAGALKVQSWLCGLVATFAIILINAA